MIKNSNRGRHCQSEKAHQGKVPYNNIAYVSNQFVNNQQLSKPKLKLRRKHKWQDPHRDEGHMESNQISSALKDILMGPCPCGKGFLVDLDAEPIKMIKHLMHKVNKIQQKFKSSVERMNETMQNQKRILKAKQKKEQELVATKDYFHKSLSRIRDSFNKGKDILNDDLQEMEICVEELKKARRKKVIKKDMGEMNGSEYNSDLSDTDQLLLSNSGRININRIKGSFKKSDPKNKNRKTRKMQPTYSQYNSLNDKKPGQKSQISNFTQKSKDLKNLLNQSWEFMKSQLSQKSKVSSKYPQFIIFRKQDQETGPDWAEKSKMSSTTPKDQRSSIQGSNFCTLYF